MTVDIEARARDLAEESAKLACDAWRGKIGTEACAHRCIELTAAFAREIAEECADIAANNIGDPDNAIRTRFNLKESDRG